LIRTALVYLYVIGLSGYAIGVDWFKAACGLILLIAVNQHPDMPKNVFGVPGLNPWNLLLASVVLGWALKRRAEGLRFAPPGGMLVLGMGYFAAMGVAFLRMFFDRTNIEYLTTTQIINDYFINSIKYVIPGLLLFDGARTPARLRLGLMTVLGVYFLFALQVLRWLPPWALSSEGVHRTALKLIQNEIGFSRVNLSMMLAGGAWAMLAGREILQARWFPRAMFLAFVVVTTAQALTGGRMGYVTWGVIGLVLGLIRWPRYLLVAPVIVWLIIRFLPGVADRAMMGVDTDAMSTGGGEESVDSSEVTSGRTDVWPAVIEKIKERPWLGHGMLGMNRTGLVEEFTAQSFPHPHNAYLEVLLDSGVAGLIPVVLFMLVVLGRAGLLFVFPRDSLDVAAGGIAFSLTLALMVASFGSQHFLPQEGSVGMWAAIGLMVRVSVDRSRARRQPQQKARRSSPWAPARMDSVQAAGGPGARSAPESASPTRLGVARRQS
jgi:O-antigen ligase